MVGLFDEILLWLSDFWLWLVASNVMFRSYSSPMIRLEDICLLIDPGSAVKLRWSLDERTPSFSISPSVIVSPDSIPLCWVIRMGIRALSVPRICLREFDKFTPGCLNLRGDVLEPLFFENLFAEKCAIWLYLFLAVILRSSASGFCTKIGILVKAIPAKS